MAPVKYTGFINPRDRSKVGDIKYIWELNRLQHSGPAGIGAAWTGDANYWEEIEKPSSLMEEEQPVHDGA